MWYTRHNSGGTSIRYAHSRQIRKHNNILECLGASLNSIADSSMVTVTRGRKPVDLIIITWYHTHVGRSTYFVYKVNRVSDWNVFYVEQFKTCLQNIDYKYI